MHIISGKYKGKSLVIPNKDFRPTQAKVREAIFNIIGIKEKTILDLCAGSGSIGYEALSRGALHVTFIDIDRESVKSLFESSKIFSDDKDNIKIKRISADDYTKRTEEKFDVIYFDPPYNSKAYEIVINNILEKSILNKDGVLIVEIESRTYKASKYFEKLNYEIREYGKTYILIFRNN